MQFIKNQALNSRRSLMGFTMVELIVVILIIAVLATFALPRFLSLSTSGQTNSTNSLAAALAAASAQNFALRTSNSALGSTVGNCTDIGPLLPTGLPAGYSITSLTITAGASATCILSGPSSTSATFRGLGIA